jgi:hypothetical protein
MVVFVGIGLGIRSMLVVAREVVPTLSLIIPPLSLMRIGVFVDYRFIRLDLEGVASGEIWFWHINVWLFG